jgi:LPXTG-motif cell wall-anchored protein
MLKKNLKYCIFSLIFSTMLMFSAGTIHANAAENQDQTQMDGAGGGDITPADNGSGDTTPADNGSGDTTPADNGSGDTTPAEDGSGDTTPAEDGNGEETPAEGGNGETTPAGEGSEETTPAEGEETPEEKEEPLFQDVFVNFIDNANDRQTVRSHVDSRSAEEKKVNYYVVGTTASTIGNTPVYSEAYLTLAKWELKDKDGNVLTTSEDISDWAWDLDITGQTNHGSRSGVDWNIVKKFAKSELTEQSYRYIYMTDLFSNGMAKKNYNSSEVYNVKANKLALLFTYKGQNYRIDMTEAESFFPLYHKRACNAFGIVTDKESKDIRITKDNTKDPDKTVTKPDKSKSPSRKASKKSSSCDVPKTGVETVNYDLFLLLAVTLAAAALFFARKRNITA